MPTVPFCLPGPQDIHNAGSVKLAEATRIRLILPGLNLASSSKSEASVTTNKQGGKVSGTCSLPLSSCSSTAHQKQQVRAMVLQYLTLNSQSGRKPKLTYSNDAGDAAAASAKAQKKLRKLQGIASQAEQAHSGIIVDEGVLESDEVEADEPSTVEGGSIRAVHRSSTGSSSSEQEKRKGPGRTAAASTAATGAHVTGSAR
jgi:hypothetical protein